ncbi:hypothetical protein GA0070607_0678 [Micromonospora coriariae]|uniref:Uncharacterized protein n=1 Tax=Micromonospora coriariae TaxID=285665 RepID=A0A1C4UID7_9ACTN|nr:hypothetical protein GA0070607_0678 [Micromonospora coriariae]
MRILSTTPSADAADSRTGWPPPALTRRRHVDMMRVCSAACRGRAAY